MKNRIISIAIIFIVFVAVVPSMGFAETAGSSALSESVAINSSNFPDKIFRKVVAEYDDGSEYDCYYDTDLNEYIYFGAGDGYLSKGELSEIYDIRLYDSSISDLTGIEYLTSLLYLDIYNGQLKKLPQLPDSLIGLDISGNPITKLPKLPAGLKDMYCSCNKLKELPDLPYGLERLYCYGNLLTELPELPDTLEHLNCNYNKNLTYIPNLPLNLKCFECCETKLKSIPKLPSNLETLDLCSNEISGVLDISYASNLKKAYLWGNKLTGLKVSDIAEYEEVNVSGNAMTSKKAVTGSNNIDWNNVFTFGEQKSYCEAFGHKFVKKIDKATVSPTEYSSGRIYYECSKCGIPKENSSTTYPALGRIVLSRTFYTYDGKIKKPRVTVYGDTGKKMSSSIYTVKYSKGCKNVGKYKVTLNFKGDYYEGSISVPFKINPKGTVITKLTKPAKKQIKVTWKKQAVQTTGYQIRYSTKQNMNGAKKVTVGKAKTTTKTIKQLKAKKKYWVQVRTYKTVNGVKFYSGWSGKKVITTK